MCFMKNERIIIFIAIAVPCIITTASGENRSITADNTTCENIEITEFPADIFTKAQKKCGAIILHVIFAVYCFATIAFICSERFLPTITCISEDLKLSHDVTAASFMSIATSAPELFSNIIGTFLTKSAIGIGHIIGNGYFNMFFVAAVGGIVAKQEIILECWPLTRDCVIYAFVTLTLTGIIWDGIVKTYETLILLFLYFVYFIIIFNDKKIMIFLSRKLHVPVIIQSKTDEIEKVEKESAEERRVFKETEPSDLENECSLPPPLTFSEVKDKNDWLNTTKKILCKPINFLIQYTIPDVRTVKLRKYYPVAFLICMAWIGILTYLGIWMVSVIGSTFGISDLVMGMTVVAAGGSIVEAYCVYWKAKRGECSIGLSNALGCNNIDATLCLALPWFIKTLLIQISVCGPDSSEIVLETSLIYINCLLLVGSVIALLTTFYFNKFKLDKKSGIFCGSLYVIVLFVGISVESYDKNNNPS